MGVFWLLGLVVLAVASYMVPILLLKRHIALVLVLLTGFWVIVAGFLGVFIVNADFRTYVNTFINPAHEHVTLDGYHAPLPLPADTAFRFRSAHEVASYVSRQSAAEALAFYKDHDGIEVLEVRDEQSGVQLSITYEGSSYVVTVTPQDKSGCRILVESV